MALYNNLRPKKIHRVIGHLEMFEQQAKQPKRSSVAQTLSKNEWRKGRMYELTQRLRSRNHNHTVHQIKIAVKELPTSQIF